MSRRADADQFGMGLRQPELAASSARRGRPALTRCNAPMQVPLRFSASDHQFDCVCLKPLRRNMSGTPALRDTELDIRHCETPDDLVVARTLRFKVYVEEEKLKKTNKDELDG